MEELKIRSFQRPEDVNASGISVSAYWETDVWCIDGSVVIGFGDTEKESKDRALHQADERHRFLASDAKTRLKEILSHAPGSSHLLANDVTQAIKALAEIVLGL